MAAPLDPVTPAAGADRRRQIATVIAVAATGVMLVALLVAAIVFLRSATSLPKVEHPGTPAARS